MKALITTSLVVAGMIAVSAQLNAQAINIIGDSTTSATVLGPNSNLGNGDYQSIAPNNSGGIPYTEIPNWFHVDGLETVNHGQTNGVAPLSNPQAGAMPNFVAFQFNNRTNINDTSYTPTAGDVFSFGAYYIPNGGGLSPTDMLTVSLYSSTAPVDADVTSADLTEVGSVTLLTGLPAGMNAAFFISAPDFYTADGTEGPLYLGLRLTSGTGVFSRTDLVSLSVVPANTGGVLLGDVDLNNEVNFLDIAPFIAVLSSGGSQPEADIDQNGEVNFLDIQPFIEILSGG